MANGTSGRTLCTRHVNVPLTRSPEQFILSSSQPLPLTSRQSAGIRRLPGSLSSTSDPTPSLSSSPKDMDHTNCYDHTTLFGISGNVCEVSAPTLRPYTSVCRTVPDVLCMHACSWLGFGLFVQCRPFYRTPSYQCPQQTTRNIRPSPQLNSLDAPTDQMLLRFTFPTGGFCHWQLVYSWPNSPKILQNTPFWLFVSMPTSCRSTERQALHTRTACDAKHPASTYDRF